MSSNDYKVRLDWIWIVMFGGIIAFLCWAHNYLGDRYEEVREKGREAVGTLSDIDAKFMQCEFSVGDSSYTVIESVSYKHLVDGEQYIIKYLPEDTEYIDIDYSRPVLSNQFEYDVVAPREIDQFGDRAKFSYIVDDREYIREGCNASHRLLSVENCIVRYRRDDPRIGYLMPASSDSSRVR